MRGCVPWSASVRPSPVFFLVILSNSNPGQLWMRLWVNSWPCCLIADYSYPLEPRMPEAPSETLIGRMADKPVIHDDGELNFMNLHIWSSRVFLI